VPAAIQTWFRYQRCFEAGVIEVIRCGGDTDTTAAIVGGIIGSAVGIDGIPPTWLEGLWEWPRSVAWMTDLGRRLGEVMHVKQVAQAPRLPAIALLCRNLVFLAIVLAHALRRCLPPY
jgi:hypothetical protein